MNHISIICLGVRDMARSVSFYRDSLGFRVQRMIKMGLNVKHRLIRFSRDLRKTKQICVFLRKSTVSVGLLLFYSLFHVLQYFFP